VSAAEDPASALANEVLLSCTVEDGKLKILEPAFLAIGKRVHESVDKTVWATALIALSTRLKGVDGAGDAAERSAALAAIALGDVALNGMLCKKLYLRTGLVTVDLAELGSAISAAADISIGLDARVLLLGCVDGASTRKFTGWTGQPRSDYGPSMRVLRSAIVLLGACGGPEAAPAPPLCVFGGEGFDFALENAAEPSLRETLVDGPAVASLSGDALTLTFSDGRALTGRAVGMLDRVPLGQSFEARAYLSRSAITHSSSLVLRDDAGLKFAAWNVTRGRLPNLPFLAVDYAPDECATPDSCAARASLSMTVRSDAERIVVGAGTSAEFAGFRVSNGASRTPIGESLCTDDPPSHIGFISRL